MVDTGRDGAGSETEGRQGDGGRRGGFEGPELGDIISAV